MGFVDSASSEHDPVLYRKRGKEEDGTAQQLRPKKNNRLADDDISGFGFLKHHKFAKRGGDLLFCL
jgi:hypothetical protein